MLVKRSLVRLCDSGTITFPRQDKCKAFYEENWRRWEEEERSGEQPEWFDKEFKELVPRELLPTYVPTLRRHVETCWNEARHDVDHKGRELDQEGIRAMLPLRFSAFYLPMEKCKAFYEENWRRWEERQPQPVWFDEEFKESVPRELLPTYVSRETLSS